VLHLISSTVAPVHRAGWPFVAIGAVLTLIGWWLWAPLGWLLAIATGWVAYFFRDPDRVTPVRPGLVVSPADGRVQLITQAVPPAELGMGSEPLPRISVFLNIFDVHINRLPCDGRIAVKAYRPGKFLSADLDKASEDNERLGLTLELAEGRQVGVVQIAGLVARRIVCWVEEGQAMRAGQRFGLIRFGSRVDLYLPAGTAPLVAVGQRAIGGETILADLASAEPPRQGENR